MPNFSEGRDPDWLREIVGVIAREGADVLDWSSDPDHHRSVVTFIGDPRTVEAASVAAAKRAMETIDLRRHAGVHPRVGALDVLPFIPLAGLTLKDAARSARSVGSRLAELGLPVYLYGHASTPPGRRLAPLRKGGFELLSEGFPEGREPDLLPEKWEHPGAHPSAGVTCVGARAALLAWNVFVEDVGEADLRGIASSIRETGGGFEGLRALGLVLPSSGRLQLSM
ncbi:MAG: glutamate formiminotransferase, partial [Gemmatimonadota bacterium]